jgi:UDP-N-acetylglucosamine 2-epimerase
MHSVLSIVGTRPEAIKMAPVLLELSRRHETFDSMLCSTGQHREMLRPIFALFHLTPRVDLDLMEPNQTLSRLTARLFESLDRVVLDLRPDWILAQGDTTTVLVASLVAYYHGIRFGHVEAGLRTGDLRRPFPEELNRCVADKSATLLFAPTEKSRQTLLGEGVEAKRIIVTGNTVIDALYQVAGMPFDWSSGPLGRLPLDKRLVLVTAHRRESFGEGFRDICLAIRDLADRYRSDGVHFVYPVHLNPNVRDPVNEILAGVAGVTLLEPLDYPALVHLMQRSTVVLTDSGGIQEEAPGLGIPVLVLRDTTERPEGVDAGSVKLVGTSRQRIFAETSRLLENGNAREAMANGVNPYGDGQAARRIVDAILASSAGAGGNA